LDWGSDSYFVAIAIDENGGSNYTEVSNSQLLSVPYALYAKHSNINLSLDTNSLLGNGISSNLHINPNFIVEHTQLGLSSAGDSITLMINGNPISFSINDLDSDTTNELQTLSLSGNQLSLTDGGTITLPADADGDSSNEIQTITKNGNQISLSNGGGSITLDNNNDNDASNEIQVLSLVGNQLSLSQGGGTVLLTPSNDNDSSNELQTLTLVGNQLILSQSGGTITLPNTNDNDSLNEIQQLNLFGNVLSLSNGGGNVILPSDGDGDNANELQTLSQNGNQITLSNGGGSFNLPVSDDNDSLNEIQSLSISGSTLSLTNGGSVTIDESNTNELQTITLSGDTISISNGNSLVLPNSNSTYVINNSNYNNLPSNMDNQIVQIEEVINLNANYTKIDDENMLITGGGFKGDGTQYVSFDDYSQINGVTFDSLEVDFRANITVTNCKFTNCVIDAGDEVTFIGCELKNITEISGDCSLNNCKLSNSILPSNTSYLRSIVNSDIDNCTINRVDFINGCEIDDCTLGTFSGSANYRFILSNNELDDCKIYARYNVIGNHFDDCILYLESGDELAVTGNTFDGDYTGESEIISISMWENGNTSINISGNSFSGSNSSPDQFIDVSGYDDSDYRLVKISNNNFLRGKKVIDNSGSNHKLVVTNNALRDVDNGIGVSNGGNNTVRDNDDL
ncbi:MAG: hypothetical protein N4A74_08365, partial [Carboxylicivirga sp.]|nr:hypothetical protein [Carboxylicivirga sp.]